MPERKKCPIRRVPEENIYGGPDSFDEDCLEDECAWWVGDDYCRMSE
jgi:hypothetical protein